MARKKKQESEDVKHEILIGYVTEFEFNDPVAERTLAGHPFVGRVYQIIKDEIFGYRLHIGVENTKDSQMAGILLGNELKGTHLGKWRFRIDIITKDNFIDFDITEEDAQKLSLWFNTDNKELKEILEKPVSAVATDENGELKEVNIGNEGELELTPFEFIDQMDIRMREFSDNINLIYDKDPHMMLVIGDLVAYLSTTYSDKYEASGKTNYGKQFLLESKSADTTIFNTMKYIQRYATTGFEKSQNIKDVYKAIHYLLFELERKHNNG